MISIECRTYAGIERIPVPDAIPVGDSGLAVHRDYKGEKQSQWAKTWGVTHRPSGLRILGHFKTRRAALAFAEQIVLLTDWTEDKETVLAKQPKFMPQLREIREAFRKDRIG